MKTPQILNLMQKLASVGEYKPRRHIVNYINSYCPTLEF